jgi:aminopeptidase N
MRLKPFLCTAALLIVPALQAQFKPPEATVHFAPDRDYDLLNVSVEINVDYDHRLISGSVVDTLAALRDGETTITLDAGKDLKIDAVEVDGRSAIFKHDDRKLVIATGHLEVGKPVSVKVTYSTASANGRGFGAGEGGWHWINPRIGDLSHIGFWTQGESGYNSNWVPLWDYPNDFATSESKTTVPADWTVIGNGVLVSNTLNPGGKTRTFDWKMTLPHATYLLSLCGGPFDVAHDSWRGVPLWYVVPKGEGNLIPGSFNDTPDMLSFYSDVLGFKYAWPKYAEDAMYDFGGGMENVSATTLGEPSLTDARAGYNMASLNSHELGHQWFGDTVTTKDWGQIWLNESFATYMQIMYFEHSRGRNGYDREIESAMQGYFRESRRYHRPVVTNLYSNADAMFDQHTYPKGGVILHTLRKQLGDQAFFAGLHRYLTLHQHTPVETNDLCEAMTDASGINCHPFFDQWLFKPGHPVIDTTWSWDDAAKAVVVHVKQTQSTADGTPIYNVGTMVGVIDGGHLDEVPVQLNLAEQDFRIPRSSKPDAVLFDPEHNFLREIPDLHWADSELPFIAKVAPNGVDKTRALRMMIGDSAGDAAIQTAVQVIQADTDKTPAIDTIYPLARLKKDSLRPFFESLLNHANYQRRGEAIRALGQLPATPELTQKFRSLVNDSEPYPVVLGCIEVLSTWDVNANLDILAHATAMHSLRNIIRSAAYTQLAHANSEKSIGIILADTAPDKPAATRAAAVAALGQVPPSNQAALAAIRLALKDKEAAVINAGVQAANRRADKDLLPDLQAAHDRTDLPQADLLKPAIQTVIDNLK